MRGPKNLIGDLVKRKFLAHKQLPLLSYGPWTRGRHQARRNRIMTSDRFMENHLFEVSTYLPVYGTHTFVVDRSRTNQHDWTPVDMADRTPKVFLAVGSKPFYW